MNSYQHLCSFSKSHLKAVSMQLELKGQSVSFIFSASTTLTLSLPDFWLFCSLVPLLRERGKASNQTSHSENGTLNIISLQKQNLLGH